MATKKEKKTYSWENPEFDLPKAFEEELFKQLIEYSKNNEHNLMTVWLNQDTNEARSAMRLGTALLSYFEHSIEDDIKVLAAFKLGELSGHLGCLNLIDYENLQDRLALAKLASAKVCDAEYEDHFEAVIKELYCNGTRTLKELAKKIPLQAADLEYVLNRLLEKSLLHYYEHIEFYTLSDMGIRVARQLAQRSKD